MRVYFDVARRREPDGGCTAAAREELGGRGREPAGWRRRDSGPGVAGGAGGGAGAGNMAGEGGNGKGKGKGKEVR